MVRTYIRKTQKGAGTAYSTEDLNKALEDIKNGIKTTRGAAMFYKIPRSTLKHCIRGTRGTGMTSREGKGGGGVQSYLSPQEEKEIADCLKIMDKNGFGLSKEEVLDMVQLYIRQNNIESRFKDQRPGTDWFLSFKARHGLSIRKPQSIEHVLTKWQRENPRKKIPKQIFVELITNLSHEMPEQNIVSGFQATEIYDESKGGPNRLMIPETLFKKDDVVRYKKNLPTSSQFIQVKASSVSEISASPSHSVEAEASSVLITEQPKTSTSSAKTQPDTCLTSTAAAPDACPLSDTMLLESSATSVAMGPDTCPASVEVELKASKFVESAVMQQATLSGTSRNQPEASSAMVQAEVGCIRTTSGRKSFEELLLDMFNNIEMDEDGFIPVEAGKFGLKEKEENYYCKKRIGPNVTAFQVDQMFSVHVLTTQKNLNAYSHDKKVIPVCKKLCMHITRIKPKRLINIADKILNGKSLRENRGGDRVSSKSSAKKTSLLKKCPLNKPEKKNRHYQGRGIEQEDKSQIQNNKIKSNGKFRFENKDEQAIKLNKKDWTFKKIVDEPLQQLPLGDPITDGKKDIDSLLKKLYGDNWSDDEKFSFYKKIMLEGREINQEDGKEADIGQCDCLEDDCGLHV
ncbi:hypothetical protein J6590_101136 [Homalodisca vitripennis]|nr:hypothetical protein J6590_101136 [Homalodisca vitripennis]